MRPALCIVVLLLLTSCTCAALLPNDPCMTVAPYRPRHRHTYATNGHCTFVNEQGVRCAAWRQRS